MFTKILAPLDGSENAEKVLPWLRRYGGPDKAEVVLLRVIEPMETALEMADALEEAQKSLRRVARELNFAGIPTRISVRKGQPAHVIVQHAQQTGCELIVMTTRGGSPVRRWTIGGTTERVMRQSSLPVLVVQSRMPLPKQGRVHRILVPVDGSALAESVLPWVERLAQFHRAKIVFFHVYPPLPAGLRAKHERSYEALRRRMTRTLAILRDRRIRAAFRVQQGDPGAELLDVSADFDVIAMTTHGYGGFKRWLLGSVAEKVIHGAEIPVFIYKQAAAVARREPLLAGAASA